MSVKPIPDGFHTATPYLVVKGASVAIEFYKKAFNAQERFRMVKPDGVSIGHAEIVIGNSIIMLADEAACCKSPETLQGTPFSIVLYMENVDELFHQAIAAGATILRPLENMFYGDRSGGVTDPFGHQWYIMTHIEDVSPDELNRRMAEAMKKPSAT